MKNQLGRLYMDYPILKTLSEICDGVSPSTIENTLINTVPKKSTTFPKEKCLYFPFESHKFYEIAIQLSGTSEVEIGKQFYVLESRQILIVDRNTEHRLGIKMNQNEQCVMLWVAATNETIRPGVSTYENGKRRKEWALDISAPGAYLIREILAEVKLNKDSSKPISQYLAAFLMMLIRKLSFAGNIYETDKRTLIVKRVKHYISSHILEPITLAELGKVASISPNYLCTIFKQIENETIVNFIQDSKVKLSITYLMDTNKKISEIAESLGYYDQFHFSKTFKKFMGMSPANYRATYRNTQKEPNSNDPD